MVSEDGNQVEVRLPVDEIESDYIKHKMMKLSGTAPLMEAVADQPLIQRVPVRYQKVEFKEHFEPSHVALGPIHHGDPRFQQAEELKLSLAARFINEGNASDKLLFYKIRAEIKDLRKCYNPDDVNDYDDESLAWMLFVDGCAVLHLTYFFDSKLSKFEGEEAARFFWHQMRDDLSKCFIDMMRLENQLPFRVLRILMGSTRDPRNWESGIKNFITGMSKTIFGGQRCEGEADLSGGDTLLKLLQKHLTQGDVLKMVYERISYSRFRPFQEMYMQDTKFKKIMTSVMDLKESGIVVRPCEFPVGNISFSSKIWGTLKMPILTVNQSTATMFMNLAALETCSPDPTLTSFKSYTCFLASLIQTPQDVKELRVAGMLRNYLGSDEEVARLFHTMSKGLVPDPSTYSTVRYKINNHCNSRFIRFYSNWGLYDFGTSWSVAGLLAALAALVVTLLQTYYAVNPKPNQHP